MGVHFECTQAYARWRTEQDSLDPQYGWRLPTNHEWEKMARGADDRRFPWGYRYAPQWSHTNHSFPKRTLMSAFHFPIDESPYGIRALSGCIREFTSIYREKDGYFEVRGSSWFDPARHADVTSCNFYRGHAMHGNIGFRLVRSIPPQAIARIKDEPS